MTHNNSTSFETPNRSGNYVNRSSLTSPTSPITPIPSLILNQTDTSIGPQRTVRRQQRPQRPNASHPPTTNIVEKILVYETLHRNCVSQYYATGKISSRFIRTCILNAGGTNSNENKVVLSKLVKWVNNKRGNTRIKALNTLRLLVRNKVEQFSELLSQVPALMEYESITPFDLATLIIDTVTLEAFDSDPFVKFLVSQCFTIEEKEWYSGSKPLISLIVKALRGVSQKFIDSPDELTYTEKVAFEFTSIPLYAPLN
ncbi:hypothetical protein DDB_G0267230 [Dictyostelium discoideum AX4]|uniref:Uncharacterized protein n=1 Tax=Dictyostelium discoideum TaxID=44689 RepID=Q55H53_DICDI|nr:hypothetical protein DDB_G0267230 [Dictyostelium discoideum AX4]EAL73852.1 hypothetical protein DDB_G0267230 [Dictyostelium discoideum AX4]|eukprot:XP_647776.1 hypothetical protein DDB_G0267230 [Dictyostelium discoideum AX4]